MRTRTPVGPDTGAAAEGREEPLTELPVHEAVGDGIAARGHVGEQVDQVHGDWRYSSLDTVLVKDVPRLKDVGRRPAHKELHHYDQEHLNHSSLGRQGAVQIVVTYAAARLHATY